MAMLPWGQFRGGWPGHGSHKEVAIVIYANSPGLSGSLLETALISRSPVWVAKFPR